jgi:hypothetical protein
MSKYFIIGISLTALFLTACFNIKVATIPPPHPTAKLRIYVCALSTKQSAKGKWGKSLEEFSFQQVRSIEKILQESGIYEVVNDDDVNTALGKQQPTRSELESSNWTLARQIAGALHADYAMIIERGIGYRPRDSFFEAVLINATTGKQFGVSLQFFDRQKGEGKLPEGTRKAAYRELFRDAKTDLLSTAIRKSRLLVPEPIVTAQVPPFDEAKGIASASDQIAPTPISAKTTPAATTEGGRRIIDIESVFVEDEPVGTGERLVVYDLEAADNLRPTALILSESLREELFKFRRFSLVNRENLLQIIDELKFQQSGLVDEKQAVQLGKVMAANQVVTGRFGSLGGSYILQAKRIDVQSFATKGLGSLKCKQGEEELLLEQLPALAKKLAEEP